MKKHFPNTLTCCNLISGCIATYWAFQSDYQLALLFVVIGAIFDFFDGFAARLLHVSSPIGKEVDSLADDVTFGFAPSAVVYSMISSLSNETPLFGQPLLGQLLPYAAFIMAAFSALRLAKFNLDERQTTTFIGLPTPANALFWTSLAASFQFNPELMPNEAYAVLLIVGVLVASWLLIAEIPMFALKFKSYGWQGNELRYGFIAASILLLAILGLKGFAAVIVLYVLTSIANNLYRDYK